MRAKLLSLMLFFLMFPPGIVQAQSGPIVKQFEVNAPEGYVSSYHASWSPDSSLIAISFQLEEVSPDTGQRWQVYDVQTGELVNEFQRLIAWSADSQRLVAQRAENVPPQIMDAHTGALLGTLAGAGRTFDEDMVQVLPPFVFSGDAIPNLDRPTNTLRFYNTQTGELLYTLNGVLELPVYTRDHSCFAVNTSTGVQVYDATNYSLLQTLEGFDVFAGRHIPWSLDNQFLLVEPNDRTIGLRSLYTWNSDGELSAPINHITGAIGWSPDGSLLAVPVDQCSIQLHDVQSGELVESISGFSEGGLHVEDWQENYLVLRSGNYDLGYVLNVWDIQTHVFLFQGSVDVGYQASIQAGILEVYEPLGNIRRIDLATGNTIQKAAFDRALLSRSPDGRWLAGDDSLTSDEVTLYIYQSFPFDLVATLPGDDEWVSYETWSPDSAHFASVGVHHVIVWNMPGGEGAPAQP